MKKSEKLYRSLGSVRDEWLDEAIGADVTKNKIKASGGKTVALRRILVAAAVCVLSVSLAITCVANADLIKSLFQREEELINPYAAMIDETSESEGVSVKMDKIAKDGDRYIIYLHLGRPEGFEPGFLSHNGITIEQKAEDGSWITTSEITGTSNAETALLAGITLMKVPEKTSELDLLLTVRSDSLCFSGVDKSDFRLTVNELATVQYDEVNGGTAKYAAKYADTLTMDFEFDESKAESLPETVSYPDIDFEVDGSKFRLTEMRFSPMHLEMHIEDPIGETFEVAGKDLFVTNKLSFGTYSADYKPGQRWYDIKPYHTLTDEELKWLDEYNKKLDEHIEWQNKNHAELRNIWFSPKVETAIDDSKWSIGINYETTDNGEFDMNKLILTWYFSKPMYEEDILSIGFERYIYEDEEPTADSEYTIEKVVVWENPNAVKPEAANPAAE